MIDIKVLATGSKGNCYRISDGNTHLLLEMGISFKAVQAALNFKTSEISGVLITHEHKDHSQGVVQGLKRGMTFYMSEGTKRGIEPANTQIRVVKEREPFRIGTWNVMSFNVEHDANEPTGFLLQSDNGAKLLFATDTYYIRYRFSGLTHIMIECNYDEETMQNNVDSGVTPRFLANRIRRSHFSLENLVEFFRANDLSKVQEIHLLHLSETNSNAEKINRMIHRETGRRIYIH